MDTLNVVFAAGAIQYPYDAVLGRVKAYCLYVGRVEEFYNKLFLYIGFYGSIPILFYSAYILGTIHHIGFWPRVGVMVILLILVLLSLPVIERFKKLWERAAKQDSD